MNKNTNTFEMKRTLSILVVGIFILMAFVVVDWTTIAGDGSNGTMDAAIDEPVRFSGSRDLNRDPADQMFYQTGNYAHFGMNLVTGDVNGDGHDDLIIGQGGYIYSGPKVYVYYGMTHFTDKMTQSNADASFSVSGGYDYSNGNSVACGDVNGDGIDDIIIGCHRASGRTGEVHVYFGSTSLPSSNTNPDIKIIGERGYSSSNYFGEEVHCDDFDGDGIDDIVALAPNWYERIYGNEYYGGISNYKRYNYTGLTFIIWGRTTSSWPATLDLRSSDPVTDLYVRIKGWMPNGQYTYAYMGDDAGGSLGSGDFNNDGRTDLVIGSARAYSYYSTSSRYYYAGAVWLIEGMTRTEWMQWSGHYNMLERNGEYIMFTTDKSYSYTGLHPRLGDVNGDGVDDLVVGSRGENGYNGAWRIVYGMNDTTSLKTNFVRQYPYGGYFNIFDDVTDVYIKGSSNSYAGATWLADFDGDGIDDLLLGDSSKYSDSGNYYAGWVGLFYGRTNWPATLNYASADAIFQGAHYYGYMGHNYVQSLTSGDFNNDGIDDIVMGAYRARTTGNMYYAGAAYLLFSKPPTVDIFDPVILDADGDDGKTVLAGSGGAENKLTDLTGDGIYTIATGYNNSYIVNDIKEMRLTFQLKGAFRDFKYTIGFSVNNGTFYIIDNPLKGIILRESEFNMTSLTQIKVNFSFSFTDDFLSQDLFDLIVETEDKHGINQVVKEDFLHLEKDITFEGDDFIVTRDGDPISRGQFLAGGSDLSVTGLRVIYEGTTVSPLNEKFFVRVTDSYSRIFEDVDSSGRDVYFEIPTTIDSGVYKFSIDIQITSDYISKIQKTAIIPMFYLNLDLNGPEAPTNVRFHADTLEDPESRWDDDTDVWLSWDPTYDTQQGILRYYVEISGSTRGTETLIIEEGTSTNITLPGAGVFTVSVYAEDESNNMGRATSAMIIIDLGMIEIIGSNPTFKGEKWFMTTEVDVTFTIVDEVFAANGPEVDLRTLEYKVTTERTEAARDLAEWQKIIKYNVLDEISTPTSVKHTVKAAIEVSEGKENFVWFKVSDEVGNTGMTMTYDPQVAIDEAKAYLSTMANWTEVEKNEYLVDQTELAHEMADSINPSRIWVDKTPLGYSSPTPSSDLLEDNRVTATIQIVDLGSWVDASTIQYSVSRNGISNYGGWINVDPMIDASTILAKTVQPLLFEPDSINYVRWRAKDVAGNGYSVSDDYVISIEGIPVNNPPVCNIKSPEMNDVFDTQTEVILDATGSSDPDNDELQYNWILGNRSIISSLSYFEIETASILGPGPHVITLEVTDGQRKVSKSISIFVKMHPDEVDTDGDADPDGSDPDDDNDELSDLQEIIMGTNPRLRDTDLDGVDDLQDPEPLNPLVWKEEEDKGTISYYTVLSLLIFLAVLILLIGSLIVMRRKSSMNKDRVERSVIAEGKIVSRYEELTGVGSPLLPQVKDMGLSLPPIAAQQVAPMRRAKELTETPSLPAKEVEAQAPAPAYPAKAEPMEAPVPDAPTPDVKEPAPRRRIRRKTEGAPAETTPGIPNPEDLTATAALPGSAEAAPEGQPAGSATTCDLCGSSIDVPSGATTVECPLCGEKKNL